MAGEASVSDFTPGTVTAADVIRDGCHVHLVLTCSSDWAARLVADDLRSDLSRVLPVEIDCDLKARACR